MTIDILVELNAGYNANGTPGRLVFSNAGFNRLPDLGYLDESYYYPYIADSILIKHDGLDFNNSISIKLTNDGNLDELRNTVIHYSQVKVFAAKDGGAFKILINAYIEEFEVRHNHATIKTSSGYKFLSNVIYNDGIFLGRDPDNNPPFNPHRYTGDESYWKKGVTQPRLIGKVFNITPMLIWANNLLYGFNFGGTKYGIGDQSDLLCRFGSSVTAISEIRDRGVPLTFNADYIDINALLDAGFPAAGHYNTCLAESCFILGSTPVYPLTVDAEDENTNTLQKALNTILDNTAILYNIPSYTIGAYYTTPTDELTVVKELLEGFDILTWKDENSFVSMTSIENYPEVKVNFVEAKTQGIKDGEMPILSFEPIKTTSPSLKYDFNFKRNYTIQADNDIAGSVTEKSGFLTEYTVKNNTVRFHPPIFSEGEPLVINTAFQETDPGLIEEFTRKYVLNRLERVEEIEVTVRLLESDGNRTAGILDASSITLITADSTEFTSDTLAVTADMNSVYVDLAGTSIRLGYGATLKAERLGQDGSQHYTIVAYEINTKKMIIKYRLRVVKYAPNYGFGIVIIYRFDEDGSIETFHA